MEYLQQALYQRFFCTSVFTKQPGYVFGVRTVWLYLRWVSVAVAGRLSGFSSGSGYIKTALT